MELNETTYTPDTAYLLEGSWESVMKQLAEKPGECMTVRLRLTPGIFDHAGGWAPGIGDAIKKNYLEADAWLIGEKTIHLRACMEEGDRGDSYGFGVEPDTYLVGDVSADGTFINLLELC